MQIPANLALIIHQARYDIPLFAEELLGIKLHTGQKRFATNSKQKVNTLVPANRWGKSVYIAVKHIHSAFYKTGIGTGNMKSWLRADYKTVNLGPKMENAKVVGDYIQAILKSAFPIPQPNGSVQNNECKIGWFLEKVDSTPPIEIHYANNAHTLIRSTRDDQGDSIQGKKFGYASYDECCRSLHLEVEVKSNILPRLSDYNGTLDLVSTPDSEGGSSLVYFQELFWKGGGEGHPVQPGYYSQEGSVYENEFISKRAIEELEKALDGDPLAPQILQGKFVITGDICFPINEINLAKVEMLAVTPYIEGHRYIIGTDTAIASDDFSISVVDWTDLSNIYVSKFSSKKGNAMPPELHLQNFIDIFDHYNQGDTCEHWMETFNGESAMWYNMMPDHIKMKTKLFGSWRPPGFVKVTGVIDKKEKIILALRKVLSTGRFKYSHAHKKITEQLAVYTLDKNKEKNNAEYFSHDNNMRNNRKVKALRTKFGIDRKSTRLNSSH